MGRLAGLFIVTIFAIATVLLGIGVIIDKAAEYKKAEQTRMPEILAAQGQNMLNSAHATNMLLTGAMPYVLLCAGSIFALLVLATLGYMTLIVISRLTQTQNNSQAYQFSPYYQLPPPQYYQLPPSPVYDNEVIRNQPRMYKRYR